MTYISIMRLKGATMKPDYTNTRVLQRTLQKAKLLGAFIGVDQPEAIDQAIEEALSSRSVPVPNEDGDDQPAEEKETR